MKNRKKTEILWILLLIAGAILLFGCSAAAEPVKSVPETMEPPLAEPAARGTEPEPELAPGPGVYVEGQALSGSCWVGEETWVDAGELFVLFGGRQEDGDATVQLGDSCLTARQAAGQLCFDGEAVSEAIVYRDRLLIPLRQVCGLAGLSILWDDEENTVYCTAIPDGGSIPGGLDVPILMYHAVGDDPWGLPTLFVREADMEKHLLYLSENGYDALFFEDLGRDNEYDKPVILTFDDGYVDNYTLLFPLLQKYNIKATVFLVTDRIDADPNYLTSDQIREMADSGLVSFHSHTMSHPILNTLTPEEQRAELEGSRLAVARLTRRQPFVVAYPSGEYNEDTLAIAGEFYEYALLSKGGLYTTGQPRWQIPRFFIGRDTSIEVFRYYLK